MVQCIGRLEVVLVVIGGWAISLLLPLFLPLLPRVLVALRWVW